MTDIATAKRMEHYVLTRSAQTLLGICAGITADGVLADTEIHYLSTWLAENERVTQCWPGDALAARVRAILGDGKIDEDERAQMLEALNALSGNEFPETGSAAPAGPGVPFDDVSCIEIDGRSFCLTGTFFYGTRAACEKLLVSKGGQAAPSVTSDLDYLVVGSGCSEQWANTTYGRKIQTALERKARYGCPAIIPEPRWLDALGATR